MQNRFPPPLKTRRGCLHFVHAAISLWSGEEAQCYLCDVTTGSGSPSQRRHPIHQPLTGGVACDHPAPSRGCLISPLHSYYFSLAANVQSVRRLRDVSLPLGSPSHKAEGSSSLPREWEGRGICTPSACNWKLCPPLTVSLAGVTG